MEQKAKGSENKLNGVEIAVSSTAMTRWAGNDMVRHYDKKKARSSRNRAFFLLYDKFGFIGAAFGAFVVIGNISPGSSWCNSVFFVALIFVVNVTAIITLHSFHNVNLRD